MPTTPEPQLGRMLYAPEAIAARVAEIAAELNRRFAGRQPVVVAVLKGATVFLADLLRRLTFPLSVDFVRIASYGTGTSATPFFVSCVSTAPRIAPICTSIGAPLVAMRRS